jgi:hypothetical protein
MVFLTPNLFTPLFTGLDPLKLPFTFLALPARTLAAPVFEFTEFTELTDAQLLCDGDLQLLCDGDLQLLCDGDLQLLCDGDLQL